MKTNKRNLKFRGAALKPYLLVALLSWQLVKCAAHRTLTGSYADTVFSHISSQSRDGRHMQAIRLQRMQPSPQLNGWTTFRRTSDVVRHEVSESDHVFCFGNGLPPSHHMTHWRSVSLHLLMYLNSKNTRPLIFITHFCTMHFKCSFFYSISLQK